MLTSVPAEAAGVGAAVAGAAVVGSRVAVGDAQPVAMSTSTNAVRIRFLELNCLNMYISPFSRLWLERSRTAKNTQPNITSFSKISLHFTDPDVRPLPNWRCKNMNATTAGIATRVENAIMVSKLDLYIPINWKTPNETGCISVFGKKDKAKTNSPQAVRKEKTPTATKPALTRGRMMNHNTWIRDPPSIHAASSRVSGICKKLVRRIMIANGKARAVSAKITLKYVLYRPNLLNSTTGGKQ